jgi:hypothetical protein
MKIKVSSVESVAKIKMVRLDNGGLMNLGGRSLPF